VDSSTYYLDTSALLPYYREEDTSDAVQNFLSSLHTPICISDLTEVEFSSAVSRWARMNEISEAQACLIENAFADDLGSSLFRLLSITTKDYRQAQNWISQRKTALRTLDSLHLACSFAAGLKMVTSDEVLAQAADTLGVPCRFIGA